MSHVNSSSREQGWVLISAMIFLIVMTMVALISLKFSNATAMIVGNVQTREQTAAAAQQAIEAVVNSYGFITDPTVPVPVANRCASGESNKVCLDVNSDGTVDVEVTIQKENASDPKKVACTTFRVRQNKDLDVEKTDDLGCIANSDPTVIKANPDNPSLCAESMWDVRAEARDLRTSAVVVVHQGISVNMDAKDDAKCTP